MALAFAARGLAKRYGTIEALGGVDLEIREGELVGLLGPNGAGKSTLVKIACGLVRPSSGSAEICGAPAGTRAARASLGYLAELFRFPGWATANEVLQLHQRLAGSEAGAEERAELLELVALTDAGTGTSTPCRRGCSSASESPRHWSGPRVSSSSTSRRARSIRSVGARCAGCSKSCAAGVSKSFRTRTL